MRVNIKAILYCFLIVFWLALVVFGTSGCNDSGSNSIGTDGLVNDEIALENYLKQGLTTKLNLTSSANTYGREVPAMDVAPGVDAISDTTNVQEAGVDEADIIEFDGEKVFVTGQEYSEESGTSFTKLNVYESNSNTANANLLGNLRISNESESTHLSGAYLYKTVSTSRLAALEGYSLSNSDGRFSSTLDWIPYYGYIGRTVLTIVNANDASNMTIESTWDFDGDLVSSRRIDNYLYLVMRYSPDLAELELAWNPQSEEERTHNVTRINELELNDLLPRVRDHQGNSRPLLSADDCNIPSNIQSDDYYNGTLVVMTVIDLENPSSLSSKCLASSANHVYASPDSLYLVDGNYTSTDIYKYALQAANTEYRGRGSIPGYLPCNPASYCLGEKNGVLRVLHDKNTPINQPAIFVASAENSYQLSLLKEDGNGTLTIVSSLPNEERPQSIGKPGELVYSMRSYKDYVYIVTFDKVDPLYIVDLNDPLDPFIAGELEVTGFSDYLHPVGDNLLLGIGKDAIYEAEINMTWYQGIKIELFDVSDPTNPISIASEIVGKRGSESSVLYNPHAFSSSMISDSEMLFSLPISVHNSLPFNDILDSPSQFYKWDHAALYVYSINLATSALTQVGEIVSEVNGPDHVGYADIRYDRAIFHNPTIHYLHNNSLISRDISNLDGSLPQSEEISSGSLHPTIKSIYDDLSDQLLCDEPRVCNSVVVLSCSPEVDGPVGFYDNNTGESIMYCGGACMTPDPNDSKLCKKCPPDEWSCEFGF